jgi:hypothetical protein
MKPILEASIQDCHVIGLDSIVLKARAPMVRIYFARENHVLWRNGPYSKKQTMSLGLHQHRTDITITPLFGSVNNVLTAEEETGEWLRSLQTYVYHSQITSGIGSFEKTAASRTKWLRMERVTFPRYMHGTLVHSVYVPKGEWAAWLITEGAPNERYISNLLTDDLELETADLSHLYRPMTQDRIDEDMKLISTLCEVKP